MQKTIKFNRQNKDFDMFLDGEYVGSRGSSHEAENELDQIAYDRLTHEAAPVEMAVEGALERLADEHSRAAVLADQLGDRAHRKVERAATTAFVNALIEYKAGVRPQLLNSGAWLLPSRRAGEAPHIVRMDGDWTCSCPAGAAMHWPIAMIVGIEVAGDAMQEFDGGDAETDPDAERAAAEILLAARLRETAQALDEMRAAQQLGRRLCAARSRVMQEAA